MKRRWLVPSAIGIVGLLLTAVVFRWRSSRPQHHTATVEVLQSQVFGRDRGAPILMDLDLLFVDCPGRQRKIIRGDRTFAACAHKLKAGDKVTAEIVTSYRAERSEYRSEIVKVGDCTRVPDPRDDASYEVVQNCTDLVVNGVTVGVRCDRRRGAELVEKCPWLRRK